jgi:uncharacterized protein YndB with AHSA1/START domain
MAKQNGVGLTKDAGWQFGIRRTMPVTAHQAWDFLLSKEAVDIWLGEVEEIDWRVGSSFVTKDEIEVTINVLKPYSHMRMSWKKKGWDNISMLQPRVTKGVGRSVISFHHDKLQDANQRLEMKNHWNGIIEKLESKLQKNIK